MEYYIVVLFLLLTYPADLPVNLKMIDCREILPMTSCAKNILQIMACC